MNWRARLTWIGRTDSGVVRQRLYDKNILGIGLSPLDPGAATWANAIRGEGGTTIRPFVFWYSDPHWYGLAGDGSALAYRKQVDADLARLAKPGEMFFGDFEGVSAEWLRRVLFGSSGNRGLFGSHNPSAPTGTQEGRPFGYTNAPFQNHTVVDFQALVDADAHWYSQLYYGGMEPADASADLLEILRDFRAWSTDSTGAPFDAAEYVHPFYDGLHLTADQRDGCYFTAERIPGVFSTSATAAIQTSTLAQQVGLRGWTKNELRRYYTALANAQKKEAA